MFFPARVPCTNLLSQKYKMREEDMYFFIFTEALKIK